MLDMKFIRENLDLVKMGAQKKRITIDLDALVALDDERRKLLTSIEAKKAEQNTVSKTIATATDEATRMLSIEAMQKLKEVMQKEEEELKEVMQKWQALML